MSTPNGPPFWKGGWPIPGSTPGPGPTAAPPPSADACPRTLDLLARSCAISPILQLPHPAAILLARRLAKRVPARGA
ncbi:hypothetical protein [Rhodophyticola sp.]|uniref:hypothetical protein n=1 Tax=Rhodophyticola sp. TaxID=2680032 RepID=UPI003D2A2AC3